IASSTEVIDQIMTWCIYRKYVCALIVLDGDKVRKLIESRGLSTARELCQVLQEEFVRFRSSISAQELNNSWIPVTFQILPEPFNENDGTINSTLKLVRYRVEELYGELLEYSYTKEGSSTLNPRNLATLQSLFNLE
ncbi:MAG: hypothetical protein LLF89_06245, partial [Spirochaetaceae bacterium]|nr:hypothetical protein [Spirochaetaceae bacterium]